MRACDAGLCKIEDLAKDLDITSFLNEFQKAKSLYACTGLPELQREIFEKLGLIENVTFLLELETAYREGQQIKARKQAQDNGRRHRNKTNSR